MNNKRSKDVAEDKIRAVAVVKQCVNPVGIYKFACSAEEMKNKCDKCRILINRFEIKESDLR